MNELLVVARYDEQVDWLRYTSIPHIVFNKGKDDLPEWVNSKSITNIGFEEYAYLSYIVENYDNLANRVIFTQAQPFVHSPDFLQLLDHTDLYGEVQPLSYQYLDHDPSFYFKRQSFDYLNILGLRIHVDFINENLHRFDRQASSFINIPNNGLNSLYKTLSDILGPDVRNGMLNLLELPSRIFGEYHMTPICYGAIFSTIKSNIIKKSVDYYKKLIAMDEYWCSLADSHLTRKRFGCLMEMMWLELFGYDPPKKLYTTPTINKWWNDV